MSNAKMFKEWQAMYEGSKTCEGCGMFGIIHKPSCELAFKMFMAWRFYPAKCRKYLGEHLE